MQHLFFLYIKFFEILKISNALMRKNNNNKNNRFLNAILSIDKEF